MRREKKKFCFARMGYKSYADYLASATWKAIRLRVLVRDKSTCQVCLEKGQCVHHINYHMDTMTGKSIDSLITLCHQCHEIIEHEVDGRSKNGLNLKNQRLDFWMRSHRGINLSAWKRGETKRKQPPTPKPPKQRKQQPESYRERMRKRAAMSHVLNFVRPKMHKGQGLTAFVRSRYPSTHPGNAIDKPVQQGQASFDN